MPLKSGMAGQIGYALESTPGTAVTVTRFLPLVSESISNEEGRLESDAIIANRRVLTSDQWKRGDIAISGDVQHELFGKQLGMLFEAMFGTRNTTGAGPYTHTFTPGDLKSMTVQVGRPDVAGTVQPFTYAGCKVASWELACTAGEIATVGLSLVGMTETTATALATATYATAVKPLVYHEGTVTIGGSSAKVKAITISGDNGLDSERRFMGQRTIDEPLEADLRTYEGSIEIEFNTLTEYNRYIAGTEFACVLAFTAGTESVTITMNIRYDGETPALGDRGILTQNLPFKAIASGADSTAITAVLVNGDATG